MEPTFFSDQHQKSCMERFPREFVRRRSRGCSALRNVWMDVFAVLTVVSVSLNTALTMNQLSLARSFVSLEHARRHSHQVL